MEYKSTAMIKRINLHNFTRRPTIETIMKLSDIDKYFIKTPIYQYTLEGIFVAGFESTHKAEASTGFARSNIAKCAKGYIKTAYGYIWSYEKI